MLRFVFIIALLFLYLPAEAALRIDITKGNIDPLPIALVDFSGGEPQLNTDIVKVITSDLKGSGLFKPIDPRAFIEKNIDGNTIPTFANWRQINAQGLVTGIITDKGNGEIEVSFRLWDVLAEQQIAGKALITETANWRRVSHMIADEIYGRLTGEEGYFDSRIVYVAESGPAKNRNKRLAIMDQDGANHKFLTEGGELVLTPRFSPAAQDIIYMSYGAKNAPRVYLRNLQTGNEQLIGDFPGMSFAPRFSPKGDRVIMSVSSEGSTDIYSLDLKSRKKTRLTSDGSINTSPSYSPDGSRIVFNSDRGGSQQLYVMNSDGGSVERISFAQGRYGTPVWSPRGDLIAFTKMHQGTFYIGVMRPDGGGERLLTQSYLDEGPTWSPNGRVIIFSRQERGGNPKLYSVDLTGHNERQLVTPLDASDPAWSPLLSK